MTLKATHITLKIVLILVLLVGAGLRLSAINTYPPAVSNDESLDVIDAFHIARTGVYPFYEDLGRPEPLYPLTLAAAASLIGPGVWTARLTTAFIGIVTLAALYWCATECLHDLPPTVRKLGAILAVIVLATAIGHITLSRALYRGIWQPLGMLLCIGWTLLALRTDSWRAAALSGIFLALTLYSYTAAYVFPAAFVALGIGMLMFRRKFWRRWLPILLIMAAVAAVLMLPVGVRFLQARQAVLGRASAVSGGWSLPTMIGMAPSLFLAEGDQNPQYNAARAPLIAPVLQPLFFIGLLALLLRVRTPATPLILASLIVGTLPVLLSQEVPHGLRIAGEYAIFPLVIGMAGAVLLAGVDRAWHAKPLQSHIWVWGAIGILGVLLIGQAVASWAAYRGYWDHAEQYRLWDIYGERLTHNEWFFRVDRRRFAEWLLMQKEPILLPLDEMQQLVTRTYLMRRYDDFATAGTDFVLPTNTRLLVPWALEKQDILRDTRNYILLNAGKITFLPTLTPESQAALVKNIESAQEIYRTGETLGFGGYTRLIENWTPTFYPVNGVVGGAIRYGNDLQIVGWQGARVLPTDTAFAFNVTLMMQRLQPNGHDYWYTVQILDQDGNRIASNADGPISRWLFPTTQWRAGDLVPVPVTFDVPALEPGAYQLVAGVYPQFGNSLPATNEAGETFSAGLVRIGWLKVPQPAMDKTPILTKRILASTFALFAADVTRLPDGQVQVDLTWQSLMDWPPYDATIFVHLLDEKGGIIAQRDSRPWDGQYPTFIWGQYEHVHTTFTLDLPADVPIRLRVGMYTFPGPQNLLTGDGKQWIDLEN